MDETTPIKLEEKVENLLLNIYDPKKEETYSELLEKYDGKRVILFFYPADFTFVCPTELKDLTKIYKEIKKNNTELFVVSTDTIFSHKRRIETESLLKDFSIPMISDRTTELAKYFNIFNDKTGNAERGTFIISPTGILKSVEITTEPLGRSANELLRKVQALNFLENNPGQACPSSRNVGFQTIKPSLDIVGKIGEELK